MPEELRPMYYLKFDEIVPISAKLYQPSVDKLKTVLRETIDKHFEMSLAETMTKNEMEILKKLRKQNQILKLVS